MIDPEAQKMFDQFDAAYEKATADQGEGGLGRWPENEESPGAEAVEDIFRITGVTIEATDMRYKMNREDEDYKTTPAVRIQFSYARTATQEDEGKYDGCTEWKGIPLTIPFNMSVLPEEFWRPRAQRDLNTLRGHAEGLNIEWGPTGEVLKQIGDLFSRAEAEGVPIWAKVKFRQRTWTSKKTGKSGIDKNDHIIDLQTSLD